MEGLQMHKNQDYVFNQVSQNERIYIDTCSLMDINRLESFVQNSKGIFLQCNKKIIVHNYVMAELAKFSVCQNIYKRSQSLQALDIIRNNMDLFTIEDQDDYDSAECFADPKLLSVLLDNRRKYKQLLISNDHSLTTDAYSFNCIESFNGNRINVCYLNSFGEMKMCDCAKNKKSYYTKEEPEIVYKTIYKTINKRKSKFEKFGKPFIWMSCGAAIALSVKPLSKFAHNLA